MSDEDTSPGKLLPVHVAPIGGMERMFLWQRAPAIGGAALREPVESRLDFLGTALVSVFVESDGTVFFRQTASGLPDPTRTHAVGFILPLFSWLILFYASMHACIVSIVENLETAENGGAKTLGFWNAESLEDIRWADLVDIFRRRWPFTGVRWRFRWRSGGGAVAPLGK